MKKSKRIFVNIKNYGDFVNFNESEIRLLSQKVLKISVFVFQYQLFSLQFSLFGRRELVHLGTLIALSVLKGQRDMKKTW